MIRKQRKKIDFKFGLRAAENTAQEITIPASSNYAFTEALAFSFVLFVLPNQDAANDGGVLFEWGPFSIIYQASGLLFLFGGNQFAIPVINFGSLHRLAIIYTPTEIRFYSRARLLSTIPHAGSVFNQAGDAIHLRLGIFSGLKVFSGEIDRRTGALFLGYLQSINQAGNWIPKALHAACVGNFTFQESSGTTAFDYVGQYNYAKAKTDQIKFGAHTESGFQGFGGFTRTDGTVPPMEYPYIDTNYFDAAYFFIAPNYGVPRIAQKIHTLKPGNYRFTYELKQNAGYCKVLLFDNGTNAILAEYTSEVGVFDIPLIVFNVSGANFRTEVRYYDGNQTRVYSEKIEYSGLVGNDGVLTGYLPAETDANGSARIDLKTKSPAVTLNGSGNEIESGLPEIKNALYVKTTNQTALETAAISAGNPAFDLFQDAFTVRAFLYLPAVPANGLVLRFAGSGLETLLFITATGFVFRGGTNFPIITLPLNVTPGFYAITLTRSKDRKRSKLMVNNSYVGSNNIDAEEIRDCTLISQSYGSFTPEFYPIQSYAIREETNFRQHLKWFGNSRGGNFNRPLNCVFYWLYNQIDTTTGSRILDLSGSGNHATLQNFTANELNPAHADYAIKEINSLR